MKKDLKQDLKQDPKQNLKRDFDFDRPAKRLPYTVPDGFFADLESRILAATVGADNKTGTEHAAATLTADVTDAAPHTARPTGRPMAPNAVRSTDRPATLPDALSDALPNAQADVQADAPAAKNGRTHRLRMARTGSLRPGTLRRWLIAGTAAAALAAVALLPRRPDPRPVTFAEVEQAFMQLTDEEQAELLALYRNDPFFDL